VNTPTKSTDFDRAYQSPFTVWGDIRIPAEIKDVIRQHSPRTALELGCGIGRFTRYAAQQGVHATGVDFSPVAIAKARERVGNDDASAQFFVGDVTRLDSLRGPYDISFDAGCFHCLDESGQRAYASEVSRLLKPGGIHLIWALDSAPSNFLLSPGAIQEVFDRDFELRESRKSRRRLVQSHWYWLVHKLR
jgi:SAM-dependent methyltransferase